MYNEHKVQGKGRSKSVCTFAQSDQILSFPPEKPLYHWLPPMLSHYRPDHLIWILPPPSTKEIIKFGPPLTKLSGSRVWELTLDSVNSKASPKILEFRFCFTDLVYINNQTAAFLCYRSNIDASKIYLQH